MKIVDMTIGGKAYKLRFNIDVLTAIYNKFGDTANMYESLESSSTADSISTYVWLAAELANAGADYENYCGRDAAHTTAKEISMLTDGLDFPIIKQKVIEAMMAEPKVNVSSSKNAIATVEEA